MEKPDFIISVSKLRKIANISVHCLFAIFINLYICQLTKLSVGRLRPHFLAVCRPNIDLEACANTLKYIETYNCTGPYNVVRQARLSFFSGHASIAMTAAVFCAVNLIKNSICEFVNFSEYSEFQALHLVVLYRTKTWKNVPYHIS